MQASDLGVRLAIFAALPTYGGYELDQWLDTSPLFLIAGAAFGLGGGMWSVIRSVNAIAGSGGKQRASEELPPGEGDDHGRP